MNEIKEYKEILKDKLKEIEEIEDIEYWINQYNFILENIKDICYSGIFMAEDKASIETLKIEINPQLLKSLLKAFNEEKIKELNFKKAALYNKISEDKKMRNNY